MMFAKYTYNILLHVNNDRFIIMSVKNGCVFKSCNDQIYFIQQLFVKYVLIIPFFCQHKRFLYVSHRRAVKSQASLRICAVSPEPSLLAYIKYRYRLRLRQKN